MSGGSFNYLCYVGDVGALVSRLSDLREMRDELDQHPWAAQAAHDTRCLLADLRALDNAFAARIEALQPVWHAIEWWRSNDWGEDTAREVVTGYRSPERASPTAAITELVAQAREVMRLLQAVIDSTGEEP